jgi:pimeloyl-ACP methyl ester carboxylesterase
VIIKSELVLGLGVFVAGAVLQVLSEFVPGVSEGSLSRGGRMLRWVESGSGSPVVIMDAALGEPGTMAWAAVMPRIARHLRVIAYDRAGLGLSDPADPLTLDTSVGDLAALAAHAGGSCILVGHSWSGLLAQLVALQAWELVAGLVLVDPAEETYWESLPAEIRQQSYDVAAALLDKHSRGEHGDLIRDAFQRFAQMLTQDPAQQARILDAYVACYAKRSQAEAFPAEARLFDASIPEIRRIRTQGALPDVPIVVLSATEGAREDHRKAWTKLHAELAASVARGRHVILAEADHAVNQVRPDAVAEAIESLSGAHP